MRAQRSNLCEGTAREQDCFVALLLAMTPQNHTDGLLVSFMKTLWNQDSAASQATPDEIVHRFIDLVEPVRTGGQFDLPLRSQGHEF